MTFQKGHKPYPRKQSYVRPSEIPGALVHKMPTARPQGAVFGFGTAPSDRWGGTYTHPADFSKQAPVSLANPWATGGRA